MLNLGNWLVAQVVTIVAQEQEYVIVDKNVME